MARTKGHKAHTPSAGPGASPTIVIVVGRALSERSGLDAARRIAVTDDEARNLLMRRPGHAGFLGERIDGVRRLHFVPDQFLSVPKPAQLARHAEVEDGIIVALPRWTRGDAA